MYAESADQPEEETTTSSSQEEPAILDELRSLVEAKGKSSAGWTDDVVERLRDRVRDKLGTMAEDWRPVARFLARLGVERPLAYLSRMTDDDVRDAAVPLPPPRDLRPPAPRPAKCDDPRCGPNRRLENPTDRSDLGPCPRCHPNRVLAGVAS